MYQYHLNQIDKACLDFNKAKGLGDAQAQAYINEHCKGKKAVSYLLQNKE